MTCGTFISNTLDPRSWGGLLSYRQPTPVLIGLTRQQLESGRSGGLVLKSETRWRDDEGRFWRVEVTITCGYFNTISSKLKTGVCVCVCVRLDVFAHKATVLFSALNPV